MELIIKKVLFKPKKEEEVGPKIFKICSANDNIVCITLSLGTWWSEGNIIKYPHTLTSVSHL
jgi:hypothetical protein